jgi:hypothetical protein
MRPSALFLCAILLALACSPAFGTQVFLANATATRSQAAGTFDVSTSIDGVTSAGGPSSGWAIDDGTTSTEVAVYETVADQSAPLGFLLTFTLYNNYLTTPGHNLGNFRFSVTSDDRSTFADGQQSGGDVTATWTILTPTSASATNGITLTILGDDSVLACCESAVNTVYTVTALFPSAATITGIRLEALANAALPDSGPGLYSNGNFVLTELVVDAVALPEPGSSTLILLGGAALALARKKWANR